MPETLYTLKVYIGNGEPKEFQIEASKRYEQVPLALGLAGSPGNKPIVTSLVRKGASLMSVAQVNFTLPDGQALYFETFNEVAICYLAGGLEEAGGSIAKDIHVKSGSGTVAAIFLDNVVHDIIEALNADGAYGPQEEVLAQFHAEEEGKNND